MVGGVVKNIEVAEEALSIEESRVTEAWVVLPDLILTSGLLIAVWDVSIEDVDMSWEWGCEVSRMANFYLCLCHHAFSAAVGSGSN